MPITKSAIKKQRIDKRRALANKPILSRVGNSYRAALAKPDTAKLSEFFSAADRAVKKKLVQLNRVARMKARVARVAKAAGVKIAKSA